jgi:hypothetical protein
MHVPLHHEKKALGIAGEAPQNVAHDRTGHEVVAFINTRGPLGVGRDLGRRSIGLIMGLTESLADVPAILLRGGRQTLVPADEDIDAVAEPRLQGLLENLRRALARRDM